MPHRYVCPSMGTIGRPLSQRVVTSFRCGRSFHASTRRLKDRPGDAARPAQSLKDAMTGTDAPRNLPSIGKPRCEVLWQCANWLMPAAPRRARNANAATQVGNLSFNRPRPAGAVLVRRTPAGPPDGVKMIAPRTPLIRKESVSGTPPGPPGTMIRAPSTLRISRDYGDRPARQTLAGGPNLRGRGGGPFRPGGPPRVPGAARGPGGARGPGKKGDAKGGSKKGPGGPRGGGEKETQVTINDGGITPGAIDNYTFQALYRQQRNQWDRKPYEPKYAPGSFAANELIHAGRELFRGEAPPVKIWGKLERTLNIVGMHNAEAHLKVRRVLDGDAAPFGQEEEKSARRTSDIVVS